MAPMANGKRQRGDEDVRRAKKAPRRFKKQIDYYSSSGDEDEATAQQVASDAPKKISVGLIAPKKSILKIQDTIAIVSEQAQNEREVQKIDIPEAGKALDAGTLLEQDDDDDDIDETLANTLANGGLQDSHTEEDDDVHENEIDIDIDGSEPDTDDESLTSSAADRKLRKRNDASAFATSISRILDTKLTASKRADPVLSRSKSAADANAALADSRLEAKARAQLRNERRSALERGRVKDVLGLADPEVESGKLAEEEKRLKKIAQRGVVKLFNAVRQAQVRAEQAREEARKGGVVGMAQREERATEMSKQGFLEMLAGGGAKKDV